MKQAKNQYLHITKTDRYEISILRNKGYSVRGIAKELGKHHSTISREIKRNKVEGIYDPKKAHHKAYVKRKYSKHQGMKVANDKELREYVENRLINEWSPKQISGRIKEIDKHIKYVGKDGIYKFVGSVYGRNLEKHLRHHKKRGKRIKVGKLKDRTFIDERPDIVDNKGRYGDWEGDFIVSNKQGKGVLLVLYERKSMYVVIRKIMSRKTDIVNRTIYSITGGFVCFESLTLDNDISFQLHRELSDMIGSPIYFCHPYHSWEKGGVENMNKLIRQYIPKRSDISRYTNRYIQSIQDKLNNRPRESLGFKTPLEIMIENNQFKESFNFVRIKNTSSVALEGRI